MTSRVAVALQSSAEEVAQTREAMAQLGDQAREAFHGFGVILSCHES